MLASTISKLLIGLVLISGVLLAYTQLATAISIRDLLGLDKPESGPVQTAARDEPDRKGEQEDGVAIQPSLGYEEIVKIIAVATPEQRKAVLADKETFSRFIESEAGKKSVLAAASANKIDQDEQNLFLAKRGAENVLREIYVGKLISNKIPDDFPTDEQIRTYYEKNRDKFVLGKRVYIWQIFLPYTEGMSEKDREMLKKKAAEIKKNIEDKKLDFATAAQQYSGHQTSRYKGGYMGLVNVSDLKPEVKEPVLALKPGVTSEPLVEEDGVHLVKRGEIIEEQTYTLGQVKEEIRKLLNSELRKQLRQAIYNQARETYPVDINDKKIEEWLLKLRTNIGRETS